MRNPSISRRSPARSLISPWTLLLQLLMGVTLASCGGEERTTEPVWSLRLHRPGQAVVTLVKLPDRTNREWHWTGEQDGLRIALQLRPAANYTSFEASLEGRGEAFLSLDAEGDPARFRPYNFDGAVDSAEIYRQSPHDVDAWIVTAIARQAVPTAALRGADGFRVAVSDAPFKYDNFSSQYFDPAGGHVSLRAGDDGTSPGLQPDTSAELTLDYNAEKTQRFTPGRVLAHYPRISPDDEAAHRFSGILFSVADTSRNALRQAVNARAANYFSDGRIDDYFGALAFTTAYMNLRVNESGSSDYWVIPAVAYGNRQYGRDAFWISMMLPPRYAAECLRSELSSVNHFAEYPLFAVIWAYRAHRAGEAVDLNQVQAYVDAVEERARNHAYYSYYEGDGRLDFQYWGDLMAFEKDDVIAYNQGLFALAIDAAREMGLTIQSDPGAAADHYRNLFDDELGYYPVSRKKAVLTPDALVPDLLAQLYRAEALLPTEHVRRHYERVVEYAKTPYGFKVVATPTGEYLPAEVYDIPGYLSQVNREKMPDGRYYRGGSYFLYDNLFLIDAYLHGIEGAEELLKWRVGLDFAQGATTYETLNTLTGEPWKPNMGWNVAIYAIWRQLVDEGRADGELFATVDEIID
ncbi:MAG: hypothetical protein WBA17_09780 [Saprospiraceae bacterium]